jgi:hypothetical protein
MSGYISVRAGSPVPAEEVTVAVRMFDTGPDGKPQPRRQLDDDVAFRFRSGMSVGGKPVALGAWRVTTANREVAETAARLYGGKVEYWETSREAYLQVLTSADKVQIVIDGPQAIKYQNILWGLGGGILHECDGERFLSPEKDAGKECGCPVVLPERKALARAQRGPAPHTSLTFRLAEDYDLGLGTFSSTMWTFLERMRQVCHDLERIGGEALCELSLEPFTFRPKGGPMAGRKVEFRTPVIKVLKSWPAVPVKEEM